MSIELLERARAHRDRIAITDAAGGHSYHQLSDAAQRVSGGLLQDRADLEEQRVAYMVGPGFAHAAAQWGIWSAGGIAVPLCLSHPAPELDYTLGDAAVSAAIVDSTYEPMLRPLAEARRIALHQVRDLLASEPPRSTPSVTSDRRALILYTSGTTNRPKGVVSTHANLEAQITALVEAWEWRAHDRILHVLPLHHTHGIVNVMLCALWSGATCEFPGAFDAAATWQRFAAGGLTLFMAVPTIYVKLIAAWEQVSSEERVELTRSCRALRLMVSGSAALPITTFTRWQEVGGHTLLERYGMTEIGMALSNPLHGERRAGTVGLPLPRVEVRLVDESGKIVREESSAGEIQVRGPAVFREYWQRPEATTDAFVAGWFRTGDVAVIEDGYYRILGRSSVDIIKTGGYKISALEIEDVLRTHPAIDDCAVVGLEDAEWGERVCVAIVGADAPPDIELRSWLASRLAPYKLPRQWLRVHELPRNAMGKVTKPEVKRLFAS